MFEPRRAWSRGVSRKRTLGGVDVNIHSIEVARALFLKSLQHRYRPLAAFVSSALGHRVMIVEDGSKWRQTHEVLMPAFLPSQVTSRYAPEICAVAEETFRSVAANCTSPDGEDIAIEALMRIAVARVMGHVVFGRSLSAEDADSLQRRLEGSTQLVRSGAPALANRMLATLFRLFRMREHLPCVIPSSQRMIVEEMLTWIDGKIEDGRRAGDPMPVIDALDRRFADCDPASRKRGVRAECAMLFIAGVDTTASALTFALAEIACNPQLRDEVVGEACSPQDPRKCNDSLQERYPLIQRVVHETLRRHTIVPTMLREAAQNCELSLGDDLERIVVPKDATLRYLPMQAHLSKSIWPEPKKFDPERFRLALTPNQQKSYNPFGIGPQACMGRSLAIVEIVLFLATLFRHLDVEPVGRTRAIPVQRNALFTNRPVGVILRFRPARRCARKPSCDATIQPSQVAESARNFPAEKPWAF